MGEFNTKLTSTRAFRLVKKHFSSLLKIAITVGGLAYVLQKIPAKEIGNELVIVSWPWLIVAFLLVIASFFLRAYRWMLLLRGLKASVRFGRLVELYFVGNFFNAFLPSGFGGDAVRIIEAARDVPANIAAGTVIVDRLTGLVTLFVMALLVMPFRPQEFPESLALTVTFVCLVGLIAGIILLEGSLIHRLGGWLPAKISPQGDGPIAKLLGAVQGCGRKAIFGALGVSVLFNLILVAWWDAAAKALGYDVPFTYLLLVVPILSVALLVPSVGGLGVRELLAGPLFVGAGLVQPEAVALSFLVWLILRAVSLLGAPIYIIATLRENRKRTARPADERA